MQRFYFESLEEKDDSITIKNPILLNQLIKVLRVKSWDEIIFFNWVDDIDYIFKIISVEKREVYLEKVWFIEIDSETDFDLNLIHAIPNKIEKIEYIIQKWTEIWVKNFLFFRSNRSQKLNLSENKIERLNKIIIEAVEQSWRTMFPELVFLDDIDLNDFKDANNYIFHTIDENSKSLKEIKFDYSNDINIFVWPEWGFDDEEINAFSTLWFTKIHLWNRILRAETTWVSCAFYIIQNS